LRGIEVVVLKDVEVRETWVKVRRAPIESNDCRKGAGCLIDAITDTDSGYWRFVVGRALI